MRLLLLIVFLNLILTAAFSQLTPQQASAGMVRGINIGNTMEAPNGENTWGNIPVQERAFADYKNAGFTAVRIPITWDLRTSTVSPYTVTATWMNRVEQVVDWGLKQHLIIIINAHHEDWLKKNYTATNIARFDSLWSQIATRFKDKSDSLIFEIINEPYPLTKPNVDGLNKRLLGIIRRTNPTRIVTFSGHNWSGAADLMQAAIPDVNDPYLMGYYHSYDPYPFGLEGSGTYGTDDDLKTTQKQFDDVNAWVTANNMPTYLGEYGAMRNCEYNSRMACYGAVVYEALIHNMPAFAWDDNGYFPIYNRLTGRCNEIKDIIIYTQLESPYKFTHSVVGGKYIKLNWVNRAITDSIIIERSVNDALNFTTLRKISGTSVTYTDSSVIGGNVYFYRLKTSVPGKTVMSYPLKTGLVCDPINVTPNFKIGSGAMVEGTQVDLRLGDTIQFIPVAASGNGNWTWLGPNSLTSSTQTLTVQNIQNTGAGNYTASYTVMAGCPNSVTYSVTVCEPVSVLPYLKVSGKAQIQDSVAEVTLGSGVKFSPMPATGGIFSWSGPNGYTSSSNTVIITGITEAKLGNYVYTFALTPACMSKCNFVIKLAGTSSVKENEQNKEVIVYPNPASGQVNVKVVEKNEMLRIVDASGKVIVEKSITRGQIANIGLNSGIYLFQFTGSEPFTQKVVIK